MTPLRIKGLTKLKEGKISELGIDESALTSRHLYVMKIWHQQRLRHQKVGDPPDPHQHRQISLECQAHQPHRPARNRRVSMSAKLSLAIDVVEAGKFGRERPTTQPPLAEPSSFVRISPVIPTTCNPKYVTV